MPQLYETQQYQDNGQWYGKHDQLRQMARSGRAQGMVIPTERPESPNQRLRAAGISPPPPPGGAPIVRSFQNNLDSLPSFDQFAQQMGQGPMQEVAPQQLQNMFAQQGTQRALMQQQMTGRMAPQSHQMTDSQAVRIQPGQPFYNQLRLNGFAEGGPVLLCRQGGQTQANWQQEFLVKGMRNCYIVPLNETRVDLQRIHQSPNSWTQLVEVGAQMGQSFFVQRSAITQGNSGARGMLNQQQGNGGRMLTDQRIPQQQQGGRILLG